MQALLFTAVSHPHRIQQVKSECPLIKNEQGEATPQKIAVYQNNNKQIIVQETRNGKKIRSGSPGGGRMPKERKKRIPTDRGPQSRPLKYAKDKLKTTSAIKRIITGLVAAGNSFIIYSQRGSIKTVVKKISSISFRNVNCNCYRLIDWLLKINILNSQVLSSSRTKYIFQAVVKVILQKFLA